MGPSGHAMPPSCVQRILAGETFDLQHHRAAAARDVVLRALYPIIWNVLERERPPFPTPGSHFQPPGQELDSCRSLTAVHSYQVHDEEWDELIRIGPASVGSVAASIKSGTHAGPGFLSTQ